MASDKLRVLLVLGSIRDGRQGLKVAKFMKKALATRNLEVIFYGRQISVTIQNSDSKEILVFDIKIITSEVLENLTL